MATLSVTGHEFGQLCMSERLRDRRELFRYALAIIGSGMIGDQRPEVGGRGAEIGGRRAEGGGRRSEKG